MNMNISDAVMIMAVLCAPILAVQVQKWIEGFRDSKARRLMIFKSLMATRASIISNQHVQALNMIDLEFRGKQFKSVTDAWNTYLDHLGSYPKDDESLQSVWAQKRVELLASLLSIMGKSLGYDFNNVHIKKGIYAPEAHAKIEDEYQQIRQGMVHLLYGASQDRDGLLQLIEQLSEVLKNR